MYNIEFYEDSNGKSELWEFLESLRIKAATNKDRYLCTSSSSKITEHDLMKILQNILMMTSGNFAQATIVFYIFISKMILLCFCINSAKKHKRLPNAKLIRQRLNVMITLPERRLIDYENLE